MADDAAALTLTIYSRPGCHLCDEMKAVVARAVRELPAASVTITEVDVSTDPALEREYGLEIPVLSVNGRKAAKYRTTEADVLRIVRARSS